MPLNHVGTPRKKGAVRGRESRDQSLNTKLTPRELGAVEAAAEADGCALSEWVRETVLRAAGTSAAALGPDQLMTEIVGLQLFLTNALTPVVCGERITAKQYEELLQNVKANKHRAAHEVIAQYVAARQEEGHV